MTNVSPNCDRIATAYTTKKGAIPMFSKPPE